MMRFLNPDTALRLAGRAIELGGKRRTFQDGKVSLSHFQMDLAGPCEKSITLEISSRDYIDRPVGQIPIFFTMEVPCRKCHKCLMVRSNKWFARAAAEIAQTERTWFGTLTIDPELRTRIENICREKSAPLDFDGFDDETQFQHRHKEASPLLTSWLKRIRKESAARLRYILVAEAHKDNIPHYHCLLHETSHQMVGERTLRRQWISGFSKFKLVEGGETGIATAGYVCKYLTKSSLGRVRASLRYGTFTRSIIPESYGSQKGKERVRENLGFPV